MDLPCTTSCLRLDHSIPARTMPWCTMCVESEKVLSTEPLACSLRSPSLSHTIPSGEQVDTRMETYHRTWTGLIASSTSTRQSTRASSSWQNSPPRSVK